MKQLVCFLFGLMAFVGVGIAQTSVLKGAITNTRDQVLPAAQITVYRSAKQVKQVMANEHGLYQIKLAPGTYRVVCQYVGKVLGEKKDVKILAGKTKKLDFLHMDAKRDDIDRPH